MKATFALALALAGSVSSFASMAQALPAERPATRAEVLADLELWRKAGLDKITAREAYDTQSAQYQQALAQYRQWRAGDEYRQALARQSASQQATGQ